MQQQFLSRTERIIEENVEAYEVAAPLPLYPITRNLADAIDNDQMSERVKVINLQRSLIAFIQQHREANPYLESLATEVDAVIEQLRQRQISATTALQQLQGKAEQAMTAQDERQASPLDNLAFSLRMTLRANLPPDAQVGDKVDAMAGDIAAYLRGNDGWRHSQQLESQVRMELYRRLLAVLPRPVDPSDVKRMVDDLLTMHTITA